MRAMWWWAVLGLFGCGGATGAITGEPSIDRREQSGSIPADTATIISTTTTSTAVRSSSSDDVVSAFDRLMKVRLACGRRPRTCPVDDLAVVGSNMHTELTDLMTVRSEAGIVASSRGSSNYRIDGVRVDGDTATITTCLTDDIVLVMDGAVFDDSTLSAITEWTMSLTETGWKWSAWRAITTTHEEDLCGFVE